ncbi:zinc metalloprotease, partial [Bacillus amyloliquefaciens]
AEVVSDQESEFKEGKYGKSYEDVRKEQLEVGKKQQEEDQQEEKDIDKESKESEHDDDDSEETGHEQAPNIDKPSNPSDP